MWPLLYYYLLGTSLVFSTILLGARTLRNVWLLDIIVSFLPLVTLGTLFIFVVTFIATIVYFKKISRQKAKKQNLLIGLVLFLSFSSIIASIIQVTSALDNTVLAHERDLTQGSTMRLEVGFFNKYYYNEDLPTIIAEVNSLNLDIFGMAELSEADYQKIREGLNMPYSYYDNCHCSNIMGDPIALFSMYPLSDIKTDGLARAPILEATATLSETQQIHVLVTHPDAPTTIEMFNRRNAEYQELDILLQKYRDQPVIFMGDFNLSSWSPTFTQLLELNPFLKDSARGFGLLTTWGPGFIRTRIDHMLISQHIGVHNFDTVLIPGSDHAMIHASLGL